MHRKTPASVPAVTNARFYVGGGTGILFGLGLMVAAAVGTRNQWAFMAHSPWGSSFLIFAGHVVASAAGLVALTPLIRRRQRAARAGAGLCPSCGYDLRATPGRCPECGTMRAKPAA